MQEPGAPRDSKRIPVWLKELPQGRPHEIDICYLNVNELSGISADELRPPGTDNYLVGYWFWELPTLAKAFVDQVKRVDEIWVGSNFTREALLGHTDGPIHVMPCVVNDTPAVSPVRKDLDLPEGPCIFFFHFDACSTFARKNPWAIIRAFRMAFTAQERSGPVRLVIKTINLSRTPVAAGERLVRELQLANGILLDMELSRDDMASLIASIDVYVSLHRSEGFGLGIAEAMLAKRPAIATAYSGNLEFMTHRNSCLVGYKLVSVTNNETHFNPGMEVVYEPGQLWAEPDIAQAARWMRMLYENPSARKRIGAAGAETIRTRHSAAAAGAAAAARLSQIAAEQGRLTRSARARAHARDLKVVARVRSERN
jgi:glycosyltransferase involved in cell wall biosynthesis